MGNEVCDFENEKFKIFVFFLSFAFIGLTTALSRQFSRSPSFNGTLLSVQEVFGGVLKRGIVDMTVDSNQDKFSVFNVRLLILLARILLIYFLNIFS